MRKGLRLLLLMLLPVTSLSAGQWLLGEGEASVFLPEGWLLYSREEKDRISFCDPDQMIIFQVSRYKGDHYVSDEIMMEEHLDALEVTERESSRFPYQGRSCSLGDVSFNSGGMGLRGWFLFLEREDWDYYLTAFTMAGNYESSLPLILSCLDGFSADKEGRNGPGALAAFLSTSSPEERSSLDFNGRSLDFSWNTGREEASRLLIEREAGILAEYRVPELFDEAWKRYYRMIYRDCRSDLEELALTLQGLCRGMDERETAETLLTWLQDFEYGSTSRFSDLLSPIETVLGGRGDCDALALVYALLLNRMGIDAAIMVSRDFGHALGAVSVSGDGAGFSLGGKRFVVAEMTRDVALGQIAADQADMSRWVVVTFQDYNEGTIAYGE
jgi:hypothetical protein